MRLEVCDIGGGSGSVATLSGEVGFGEVQELKARLDSAHKLGGRALLLDLANVSFIASDGLGVLIRVRTHAEQLGKMFLLVRPQGRILELLQKTQLTKIFTIYGTLEDAMAEMRSA